MADLTRTDFDDCLNFLAGKLEAPAGACEPETGTVRAGRRLGSGAEKAGSACAVVASPAGSGATSGPSTRKRPFESWNQASRSARSRRRSPSASS